MPVRFRCVYCNQLLGISSRKAGTVVRCTKCDGQIIVPEPESFVAASAKGKEYQPLPDDLLERDDLDALLQPFDFDNPMPLPAPVEQKLPPCPAPVLTDKSSSMLAANQRKWPNRTTIGWTLLAALTFVIGYLVGRASMPGP
jgi:DNA-directed RNA polymerase subunit RPC12/RpoP